MGSPLADASAATNARGLWSADPRRVADWHERHPGSRIIAEAAILGAGVVTETDRGWWVADTLRPVTPAERDALDGFATTDVRWTGVEALNMPPVSMVVFDRATGTLRLMRPPGASPQLFYRADPDGVEWSSRLSDLIRAGDRVDAGAVAAFFLQGHVGAGFSPVVGIEQVPPCSWIDPVAHTVGYLDAPEWGADFAHGSLEDEFLAAIERAAPTGRPGLLLSGGIDSVALAVGLAADLGRDPVAFTAGTGHRDGRFDEYAFAAETATALGIEHVRVNMGPEWIESQLDRLLVAYGSPFAVAVHSSNLGGFLDHGCDSLFAGSGGDSWSPGGMVGHGARLGRWLPTPVARGLGRVVGRLVDAGSSIRGLKRAQVLLDYATNPGFAEATHPVVGSEPPVVASLLGEETAGHARQAVIDYWVGQAAQVDDLPPLQAMQRLWAYVDESNYYGGWVINWSRLHGLQPALPYLDRRMAQVFVRETNPMQDRMEMRRFAARHVPDSAAFRPKIGQSIPLAEWWRGPLRPLLDAHLTPERLAGVFRPEGVERLLTEHLHQGVDHAWDLMKILAVSRWVDLVLKPGSDAAPTP